MKQVIFFVLTSYWLIACSGPSDKITTGKDEAVVKSASATIPEAMPDSATMMKNWSEYMEPGREHQMMASWDGEWDTEMTMWQAPGAPATKTTGSTTNTTILGGRYQQSTHQSTWEGMPFEGVSTLAFDKAKKIFISTWIDNMGTGIMTGEGPWDEASRSITIKGKMMDPMLLKEVDYREVFKLVDDNTQVMEMYAVGSDGKEFKSMEIRYTRRR